MERPDWLKFLFGGRLINYAENGDIKRVIEMLESGADINYRGGDYGQTALMASSRDGHYEIVKLLLESDAIPNIRDNLGNTALMYASFSGLDRDLPIVKLLLESGANPNISDNDGDTAYDLALYTGNTRIIDILKYYMNIHHIYRIQALQRGNLIRRKLHTSMARRNSALSQLSDNYGLDEDIIHMLNSRMTRPTPRDMIDEIPHNMLSHENTLMANYLDDLEQYGSGKHGNRKHGNRKHGNRKRDRTKKHNKHKYSIKKQSGGMLDKDKLPNDVLNNIIESMDCPSRFSYCQMNKSSRDYCNNPIVYDKYIKPCKVIEPIDWPV